MELNNENPSGKPAAAPGARSATSGKSSMQPGWANGLRQIYDAVVEEPLPDAFRDLLSKLDDPR